MTEFINWLSGELNNINYEMAEAIGLTLIDPEQFIGIFVRFCLNLAVVSIIARYFYYPRSKRRDYMFVFIIMSMSIFMLVSFMGGDSLRTGAALGLFALFGIIRYRTEAIPIREMTYLFMLVLLQVYPLRQRESRGPREARRAQGRPRKAHGPEDHLHRGGHDRFPQGQRHHPHLLR